jgi:hypothetical protein
MVLNQENMKINYIHTIKLYKSMVSNHDIARSHCIKQCKLFQNNYTFQQFIVINHESEA